MKISIENISSSLTVDLFGGAITDFHLKDRDGVNPLSFVFTKDEMPENNKAGAPYQGHFLCLGRWGVPSEGEIQAGVPNHGEIANIEWRNNQHEDYMLCMETSGEIEGMHVGRIIQLDNVHAVFSVKETITNINRLGRLYNIVQHPTLAAPFLDESTIINCNATAGFDQVFYKNVERNAVQWNNVSQQLHQKKYNSVFSFVADRKSETGWITAFSPKYNLLFGYVWKRGDYPWIHLWQHWEDDQIRYRGLEFGTAGIHQPFKEILNTAANLFGEKTFEYIDAGETISKKYFSFIYKPEKDFVGVEELTISENAIQIKSKGGTTNLNVSLNLMNELF
jgi:hypothetical protein